MTVLTEPGAINVNEVKPREYKSLETADVILSKDKISKICFVCTGNTCRSPMAAALYNHLFKDKKSFAVSLGLYAAKGQPISENAVIALSDYGIPSTPGNRYERHLSDIATEDKLGDCDKIIGISDSHTLELLGRFPRLAGRIMSMPRSIPDPYGGDLDRYKACLYDIEKGIKELFNLEY